MYRTLAEKTARLEELRDKFRAAYDAYDAKGAKAGWNDVRDLQRWNEEMSNLAEEIRQLKQLAAIDADDRQPGGTPIINDGPHTLGGGVAQHTIGGGFAGAFLAKGWNLRSQPAVSVPLSSAFSLGKALSVVGAPSTYNPYRVDAVQDMGRDQRFLWPALPSQDVTNETAIADFRQTGTRTVTGTVERALAATTDKATLDVEITQVTEQLKTLAIIIDDVPTQVLQSVAGVEQFLNAEAQFAVNQALDAHVLAQILAATPPNGATGADLPAKIRNAIAAMRLLGSSPDVLVLNPTDSAAIDLLQDNEARYYGPSPFNGTGSTSTLWGLRVIEHTTTAGDEAPMLIDSARLGVLYKGQLAMLADPFTGFKQNLVSLRFEANALMHVRNANAAYVVEATP